MRATLTYHSIDTSGSAISVSPSAFAEHVRWLTSGQVRVLTLDALMSHPDSGPDAVAVTFDDAFLNAREGIEQLLAHGVPVTLFIASGHVGGTNAWHGRDEPGIPTLPLLDWTDLERLAARGAHIASHTRRHSALTALGDSELDEEMNGAVEDLRARLGRVSDHFAYPYGDVDEQVASRAARYFRFAHTTEFRMLSHGDEALHCPRLDMYYFQAPGAIQAWGTPAFMRHVAWCRTRRKVRARLLGRRWPRRRQVS